MRVGVNIVHQGVRSSRGKLRSGDLDSGDVNSSRGSGRFDGENTQAASYFQEPFAWLNLKKV